MTTSENLKAATPTALHVFEDRAATFVSLLCNDRKLLSVSTSRQWSSPPCNRYVVLTCLRPVVFWKSLRVGFNAMFAPSLMENAAFVADEASIRKPIPIDAVPQGI